MVPKSHYNRIFARCGTLLFCLVGLFSFFGIANAAEWVCLSGSGGPGSCALIPMTNHTQQVNCENNYAYELHRGEVGNFRFGLRNVDPDLTPPELITFSCPVCDPARKTLTKDTNIEEMEDTGIVGATLTWTEQGVFAPGTTPRFVVGATIKQVTNGTVVAENTIYGSFCVRILDPLPSTGAPTGLPLMSCTEPSGIFDCVNNVYVQQRSCVNHAECQVVFGGLTNCQGGVCTFGAPPQDTADATAPSEGAGTSIIDFSRLNKLGDITRPQQLIGRVIGGLMGILGSIALVMMIYGGIMWMTAGGNSTRQEKALQTILWAGLGIMMIFASYALVNFIFEIFR